MATYEVDLRCTVHTTVTVEADSAEEADAAANEEWVAWVPEFGDIFEEDREITRTEEV